MSKIYKDFQEWFRDNYEPSSDNLCGSCESAFNSRNPEIEQLKQQRDDALKDSVNFLIQLSKLTAERDDLKKRMLDVLLENYNLTRTIELWKIGASND